MYRDLLDLQQNWKKRDEFKPFINSLAGVGGGKTGLAYFEKVTKVFFSEVHISFREAHGKKMAE